MGQFSSDGNPFHGSKSCLRCPRKWSSWSNSFRTPNPSLSFDSLLKYRFYSNSNPFEYEWFSKEAFDLVFLTCDAVDRAEGENASTAFKASANTSADLENIIFYLYILFNYPDVVSLHSFNISERKWSCLIDVFSRKVRFRVFLSDGYRLLHTSLTRICL